MSQHTPEPWVLFEVGDGRPYLCPASESDKTSVLTVIEEDGVMFAAVYKEADARRIVACVNACRTRTTEQLEMDDLQGYEPWGHVEHLERQRYELLAAMEQARSDIGKLPSPVFTDANGRMHLVGSPMPVFRVMEQMDAAIAKAKGAAPAAGEAL